MTKDIIKIKTVNAQSRIAKKTEVKEGKFIQFLLPIEG